VSKTNDNAWIRSLVPHPLASTWVVAGMRGLVAAVLDTGVSMWFMKLDYTPLAIQAYKTSNSTQL